MTAAGMPATVILETKAGVEVTPHMARKLLEAVVARMKDVVAQGGGCTELTAACLAEANSWGIEDIPELEKCLLAVDKSEPSLHSYHLYQELGNHIASSTPAYIAVRGDSSSCAAAQDHARGTVDTEAASPRHVIETVQSDSDERERLRKLASWHADAPDPVVCGERAAWAVYQWRDTVAISRRGEGVWSEEFHCGGRRGLRLGVFPQGRGEGAQGAVAVLVNARPGEQMKVAVEVGGVRRSKSLSFRPGNPSLAGWQLFCNAQELKLTEDGTLPVTLEIK